MAEKKIRAIDLFCGVGGLTKGLENAGIEVVAGLDNDKDCKYSYEKNNNAKYIEADITKYDFDDMGKLFGDDAVRVMVGCAPCQRRSL
jgi:DNA (cytosine-5)-methyltransferase 1